MKRFRPPVEWTRRSALAAAAGLAVGCASSADAQKTAVQRLWPTEGPPVLRGAVIAQRRRRIEVDGADFGGGGLALPAYGRPEFDALAKAGANLVVMSFPELWTVGPPYRRDAAMADILGRQLDAAKAAGLYVVLALRSGPGRSDFIFHRDSVGDWFPANLIIDSIWTNIDQQAAWASMCVDAAKLVKDRSEIAGLNLMVEPEPNVSGTSRTGGRLGAWEPDQYVSQVSSTSDWKHIAADCARKVRAAAPNLPILISPPAFGRTDFLPVMGAPPVEGTVWCVHDYEPRDYTHSPENSRGIPVFGEGGANTFAARLDAAKQRGAPVFLGEFGAARWAERIDRYYDARIAACEARGVGWAAFRWPTGDPAYEDSDHTFNVTWGDKPRDPSGAAIPTLRKAWAKNMLRPGGSRLRGRN